MRITTSGANMTSHNSRKTAPPPKKTKLKGWTKHAAIRNRNFLYTPTPEQLDGYGFALTFTVKHCDSSETWAKWRNAFFDNCGKRWDLTRYHAVTEWQKRGVPHLHCAIWFCGDAEQADAKADSAIRSRPEIYQLLELWMKIASDGEPSICGQDGKEMPQDDQQHWLQYQAKHGVRGVSNYQRHSDNIPKAWKGKTGRVWQKGGSWPVNPWFKVEGVTQAQKHQIQRIFCRYMASNPSHMRLKPDQKKASQRYWKTFMQSNDRKTARFRSPSSFIPIEESAKIIKFVAPEAYFVSEDGEVFDTVDEMHINRTSKWRPQPKTLTDAQVRQTMDELA